MPISCRHGSRLAREFDLRVVLNHVIEASLVAREIAAAGAMASIIHIDSPGGKFEAMHLLPDNGLRLAQAGVLFS